MGVSSEQSRSQLCSVYSTQCCRRSGCCYTAMVTAAAVLCCFLLLFVIVCKISQLGAGSLHLISNVLFRFTQTQFICYVPLDNTVSHTCRFDYILRNCDHALSQGGRHPAAAKFPFYIYMLASFLATGTSPAFLVPCWQRAGWPWGRILTNKCEFAGIKKTHLAFPAVLLPPTRTSTEYSHFLVLLQVV